MTTRQCDSDTVAKREAAFKAQIMRLSTELSKLSSELQAERTRTRVGNSPPQVNNKPAFVSNLLFEPRARYADIPSPLLSVPISPTDLSIEMHERNERAVSKQASNEDVNKKIKLYKFWTYDSEAWFSLVESQFVFQ